MSNAVYDFKWWENNTKIKTKTDVANTVKLTFEMKGNEIVASYKYSKK